MYHIVDLPSSTSSVVQKVNSNFFAFCIKIERHNRISTSWESGAHHKQQSHLHTLPTILGKKKDPKIPWAHRDQFELIGSPK